MPERRLTELLQTLEDQEGPSPVIEALKTERDLIDKERAINAGARRKLTRIVYVLAVVMLGLGLVSVGQQFKNGDLAEQNDAAIHDIQSNRVQVTYETCTRQNDRFAQSLASIKAAQKDPAQQQFASAFAKALGLTDEEFAAFVAANLKTTTDLVAKITLDDPVSMTKDGPRRDCERAIVDRFGKTALLVESEQARERVRALLKN